MFNVYRCSLTIDRKSLLLEVIKVNFPFKTNETNVFIFIFQLKHKTYGSHIRSSKPKYMFVCRMPLFVVKKKFILNQLKTWKFVEVNY